MYNGCFVFIPLGLRRIARKDDVCPPKWYYVARTTFSSSLFSLRQIKKKWIPFLVVIWSDYQPTQISVVKSILCWPFDLNLSFRQWESGKCSDLMSYRVTRGSKFNIFSFRIFRVVWDESLQALTLPRSSRVKFDKLLQHCHKSFTFLHFSIPAAIFSE